ncbi:MAG: DUF3352 domain-containing protein [Candidatus Limnocylindrales bacterium]|nr:DUF3352 domain-containing protein [Candidatus Limnocylindrales bacterium]
MTDELDPTKAHPTGGQDTYEPAPEAAPAASVLPPEAADRGARYRWAIAVGVVAGVVVVSALTLGLFTGRGANATVLGYVPDDSIMYGEARLDLPGDQRANVGAFLSKFPGFADQSTLDTKIDDVLDRLIGGATNGDQAFSSDIKPWFGGELAFSVGALPDPSELSAPNPSGAADARFLVLVSVKDEAAAKAWFDSVIASSGAATSTEAYGDATLTLFTGEGERQGAYALLNGKVAVAGDVASVRAAVDKKGAGDFAAQPEFKAALDATTGDHVGFVYIALRPLLEWASQLSGSEVPGGLSSEALTGLVPDWTALALRVEGDALVMETLAPKPEGGAATDSRASAVADHVPASAVALAISHDYGKGILKTLDIYRSEPSLKPIIDSVDQAIGILGGTEAAIGWIGDLGITVTRADAGVEGGLVIVPTDRAAAERLFTSLRTLASLGGATMGVSVRDEAYAGTTITIVDLGNVADLAAQADLSPEMLGTGLPTGRVELAYAITDQVVVLGSGPGFVRHVLDTTAATSIASNERYRALAARVGQGTGIGFADLTAIRGLIESAMGNADAAARAEYEENVKPFLTPFDALVWSGSVEGDLTRSTVIVTVK